MNWNNFETHGLAPERAFEALTGQLFERWCRKNYNQSLAGVCFVNGSGGDGGVEAYGTLRDGTVVGLQAKWFRQPLRKGQFKQILKSIQTAIRVRPSLARYCVAIPRSLSDTTERPNETTERLRWRELVESVAGNNPQLVVELWDENQLETLLAEPYNEGLSAYWFRYSHIDFNHLEALLKRAKDSWLRPLYNPNVHCVGRIEAMLGERLQDPVQRQQQVEKLDRLGLTLDEGYRNLVRSSRMGFFKRTPSWAQLVQDGLEEISRWSELVRGSLDLTKRGLGLVTAPQLPGHDAVNRLLDHLATLEETAIGLSPARAPATALKDVIKAYHSFREIIRKARSLHKPLLIIGAPGTGKTHALAHAVQVRLGQRCPALLLRAYDIDPGQDWGTILRTLLDVPSWSLISILAALEAQATLADISRCRSGEEYEGVDLEPTRVLIAVDGLDESPSRQKWADRLAELPSILDGYPRVVVACSVRTNYADIWRNTPKDAVERQSLPDDGDVPTEKLFVDYCREFDINCSAAPLLRWAVRTPMAVKLFSEEYKGTKIERYQVADVSLVNLILRKLDRIDLEFRRREGYAWPEGQQVVHKALQAIAKSSFSAKAPIREGEAVRVIQAAVEPTGLLTSQQTLQLIDLCRDYGLVDVRLEHDPTSMLTKVRYVTPAFNVLTDFLLAASAVSELYPLIIAGTNPPLPSILKDRPDTLVLSCVMLTLRGIRIVDSGLWRSELEVGQLESLQLIALSVLPHQEARTYREWVIQCLTSRRNGCLRVLSHLVIPLLREYDHPLGSRFIHEVLKGYTVAQRDLFWSGPDDMEDLWEDDPATSLSRLSLSSDDPFWSAPLLLAWGLTTVVNGQRRGIRKELAAWGAPQIPQLTSLLGLTIDSNDPQMVEDMLSATLGAVCLTKDRSNLLELVDLVYGTFLDQRSQHHTHNSVIRQAARGIVERTVALGLPVPSYIIESVRHRHSPTNVLLALDKQAALAKSDSYGPIDGDLAWYVIKDPLHDFFQPKGTTARRGTVRHRVTLKDVPLSTLQAALDGRLGTLSGRARDNLTAELHRRQNEPEKITSFASLAHIIKAVHGLDEILDAEQRVTVRSKLKTRWRSPRLNPQAERLLREYASAYGLRNLTPTQFVLGVIYAHMLGLGWNKEEFEGRPNGGRPGEIIGADIAIARQYTPATHGSLSPVATFAEKYVWTGLHVVTGYLADRLPICSYGLPETAPPVDLSWVTDTVPNPASDLHTTRLAGDGWLLWPNTLVPPVNYRGTDQERFVRKWVEKAAVPNLCDWIQVPKEALPAWASEDEWVTLRAQVAAREADSCGESILWLSSFVVDCAKASLLVRDVKAGLEMRTRDWHEIHSAAGESTYGDPHEAVWAPWYRDAVEDNSYITLAPNSAPVALQLLPATSELTRETETGEESFWLPASWLRGMLRTVDLHQGRFLDPHGDTLAFFHGIRDTNRNMRTNYALLIRRQALETALRESGLELFFSARLYREPAPSVYYDQNSTRWPRRNYFWVAEMRSSGPYILSTRMVDE